MLTKEEFDALEVARKEREATARQARAEHRQARAEHQAFVARAEEARAARLRGEPWPDGAQPPTLNEVFTVLRAAEKVQQAEQRAQRAAGPYAWNGQGLMQPPGSPFAPTPYQLVNHTDEREPGQR